MAILLNNKHQAYDDMLNLQLVINVMYGIYNRQYEKRNNSFYYLQSVLDLFDFPILQSSHNI